MMYISCHLSSLPTLSKADAEKEGGKKIKQQQKENALIVNYAGQVPEWSYKAQDTPQQGIIWPLSNHGFPSGMYISLCESG